MCGICAMVAAGPVAEKLYLGLKKLEYRGYDSCGMATIDHGSILIKKDIGSIAEVENKLHFHSIPGCIGLAHTRWATHGGVTTENAHPIASMHGNFVLVHNGVIDNYLALKEELLKNGVTFRSETDTEVVVALLEYMHKPGQPVLKTFREVLNLLEGCYAIAMLSRFEPDTVFGARYLLPLIIGIGSDMSYLSSDAVSFVAFTRQALFLEDGEYFALHKGRCELYSLKTGQFVDREAVTLDWEEEVAEKGGHAHYMLKEILEQPETLVKALSTNASQFDKVVEELAQNHSNFLVGVGTTYYMAMCGSYLFKDLASSYVPAISADEFTASLTKEALGHCLFISQSGETYDTKEALRYAASNGCPTSAIVNNSTSTIARSVKNPIFQLSGPEICVVSTKASVAQLVILSRLAYGLAIAKKTKPAQVLADFDHSLRDFARGLSAKIEQLTPTIQKAAKALAGYQSILCMGKGLFYPIALEAALKIKEVAYIHAEGLPTGFLKHGTIALVDSMRPCLFFIPPKEHKIWYDSTHSAIEEVKARGGLIYAFVSSDQTELKSKIDFPIPMDGVSPVFYPIFQLILSQLLAYYIALTLDRPIDQPRNLAKSVTVP